MTYPDAVRLSTALLASLAFLFFAVRLNDDWTSLTRGWRIVRVSTLGLIFVIGYGAIEIMRALVAVPLGARNFMVAVFLLALLYGLWRVRTEPPPSPKAPGYCMFPGCIIARKDLRAAADKYPQGIPPDLVRAIIDGVEAHEHDQGKPE